MAGPLDAVTARAFVGAVTRNAHELSTDAGVLLAHGRWARAHALAVAAMEEIGKASIAQDDAGITKGRKWKHGRPGHADKLLAARQFYSFVTMVRDRGEINIDEWFADEHDFAAMHDWEVRQSGLYVDVYAGDVVGGWDSVSEEDAVRTVAFADALVHACLGPLMAFADSDSAGPQSVEREPPF